MQRLSNWFEDHLPTLPLRGRRSDSRRADSITRISGNGKKKENGLSRHKLDISAPISNNNYNPHKSSRSAAPPRLRYLSASSVAAGWNYPYGREAKGSVSREEPPINYFREYRHRQDYSPDSDEEDDEENEEDDEEFLLITTSAYAAAAARPNAMGSSAYGHKEVANGMNLPQMSQSFTNSVQSGGSCRQKIRTNPWIVRGSDERLSSRSSCSAFHAPLPVNSARLATIGGRNNHSHKNVVHPSMSLRRPTPVRQPPQSNRHLALPINKCMSSEKGTENKAQNWNLYASINRAANLNGLNGLDESTFSASSGYGSQDSSPESSVHSPDWQPPSSLSSSSIAPSSLLEKHGILEDKAVDCHSIVEDEEESEDAQNNNKSRQTTAFNDKKNRDAESDEHIYHELECLNRLSMMLDDEQLNFNSVLMMAGGSNYKLSDENRFSSPAVHIIEENCSSSPPSPIYAVPYEAKANAGSQFNRFSRIVPVNNNNNFGGQYRQVKPVQIPANANRQQNLSSNNNSYQHQQSALQISSPFFNPTRTTQSYSRFPAHNQQSFSIKNQQRLTGFTPIGNSQKSAFQPPRNGLRTGILIRANSSPSGSSSSEDEEEEFKGEEYMEEEQSSTSCSSWTPMLITPRRQLKQRPCNFHAPPPPPLQQQQQRRPNEFDFLAELDQQIAELQHQSDSVRQLVEQAKERHELRSKTRQLCMEHLKELRKMRWLVHNNFELCL